MDREERVVLEQKLQEEQLLRMDAERELREARRELSAARQEIQRLNLLYQPYMIESDQGASFAQAKGGMLDHPEPLPVSGSYGVPGMTLGGL